MPGLERKRIAIVGSGSAGLGAAWALKNSDCEVHIFEKNARLGGHTNTQPFQVGDSMVPVDTGFIVMNTATYPNFINFLKAIKVDTVPTEMTFSVSRDRGNFEWSGEPQGIFAQRRNIFRLRHYRLLFDIVRFNQYALGLLLIDDARLHDMTIGEYLDKNGYSQAFRDDYLIPMTAAVWSTSPEKASLEFPALTLIRFLWNHHLLSTLAQRPPWLTIPGGSQKYIDAVVSSFDDGQLQIRTSAEVVHIQRPPISSREALGKVTISWRDGGNLHRDHFDHVILACHGDQILPMLSGAGLHPENVGIPGFPVKRSKAEQSQPTANPPYASREEIEIFNAFRTTENLCYLHSDTSFLPTRRKAWTSWNYLTRSTPSKLSHPAGVSLTYNMNILQHIPTSKYGHVLVTMNPHHEPKARLTQGKYIYHHPLYTTQAIQAQARLDKIQNTRGVSYCGAWTKYGFHEDGFSSGLKVAIEHLGAKLPFEFVDSTYSRGHVPQLCWQDYILRAVLQVIMLGIWLGGVILSIPPVKSAMVAVSSALDTLLDHAEDKGFLS